MDFNLQPGLSGEKKEAATNENTALKYGSGGVAVYATPAMIGLMEGASIAAIDNFLPPGFSTVGTSLNVQHTASTPVGLNVVAKSELIEVDGRRLVFKVEAFDDKEQIGRGTHERFIIQLDKFMQKNELKAAK